MDHDYWIWPPPGPGTIRVACEWPVVQISLSTVDLDAGELVAAAARAARLWPARPA